MGWRWRTAVYNYDPKCGKTIQYIAGATRVEASPQEMGCAGSTNKKRSTESSALEPAMRNGNDGLRHRSGCRCVVWVAVGDLTYSRLMLRVVGVN